MTSKLLFYTITLAFATLAMSEDKPLVETEIPWPECLARHDMLWKRLPRNWREAPWTGNGMLGSMYWQQGNALRMQVFRGDVQAHRPMTQGFSGYTRARLQIGSFYLKPADSLSGPAYDVWKQKLINYLRKN